MPVDLTAQSHNYTVEVVLTNANVAYEVQLHRAISSYQVQPITNACQWAETGTEGASLGVNAQAIAAAAWIEQAVERRHERTWTPKFYLQTAVGGSVVKLTLKRAS